MLQGIIHLKNALIYLNKNDRYGYVTNSKVKFVIVVDSSNTSLRDNEIRSVSYTTISVIVCQNVFKKWADIQWVANYFESGPCPLYVIHTSKMCDSS